MQTFCKICSNDNEYFLLTTWKDNGKEGFDLILTNALKAWKTSVSSDNLDEWAEKIHMKYFDYISQTKAALTASLFDQTIFDYEIKHKGPHNIEFMWKKFLAAENIKFQLGKVILSEINNIAPITTDIFSFCCNEIKDLQENLQLVKCENERLSSERTDALKRLEKCVIAKEENERFIFSKFVNVLNEKKAKIRSLKDKSGGKTENSNTSRTKTKVLSDDETDEDKSSGTRETRKRSSEEDAYDGDTDIDEQAIPTTSKSKARKHLYKVAASSRTVDEDSDEDLAPKRTKQPNVAKKSSLPVSQRKPTSLRKKNNSSQQLNKFSDIDDLLERL